MGILTVERRASAAIAWITIITGILQILLPARLLPLLGIEPTVAVNQLFATIGMFMVLFGAAVVHVLDKPKGASVVLVLAGCQKIGASLFVAWGVIHDVFVPIVLLVAGFDFVSGVLFIDLRRRGCVPVTTR